MKCPHCSQEIKPKGPDCPKCGQRIFGSGGALDQNGGTTARPSASPPGPVPASPPTPTSDAAGDLDGVDLDMGARPSVGRSPRPASPQPAAVAGLAVDKVKDLSVDDTDSDAEDAFAEAVQAVGREEEEAGRAAGSAAPDLGYSQVDLDAGLEVADHSARAAQMRESLETDGSITLRREVSAREQAAAELYDESLMGGMYLGAMIGGTLGFLKARGEPGVWSWTIGGALLLGLVGLGVGMAAGKGASAGARTRRGQAVLMGIGVALVAAPAIGVLAWAVGWGYSNQLFWTACTHFVVAFSFGALTFQDAQLRRADGSAVWGVVVGLVPPLYGLYASRRPHGVLVACGSTSCGKKHLSSLPRCPHCGYVRTAGVRERIVEL